VGEVDRFISPASKTLRFGLLLILDVLRWLPLLLVARPSAFEDLAVADRVRMLRKMDASKVAIFPMFVAAYKTVMTMVFYEDDAELRTLGYPGSERHRYKRVLGKAPQSPQKEAAVG
jgi:hypothetical protein